MVASPPEAIDDLGADDEHAASMAPVDSPQEAAPVPVGDASSSLSTATSTSLPTGGQPQVQQAADHPLVVRVPIGTPLAEVERLLIMKTIGAVSGNKQRAARMLGISRRGLYVRLAAYGEADHASDVATED